VFTVAAILALFVQGPLQTPSMAGSLVGCVSDSMNQRLPGVTVVAKTGRVQRTTTGDASGCYELSNLPVGSYRVTARITGFDNVTRDRVTIAPTGVARLDFEMRISAICECVRFGGTTLAEQWAYADAVLHVRLSASEPQPATTVGYYRHAATVLNVLKKPAGPVTTPVFVFQNQRSAAAGPYDIDQELVVFLKSHGPGGFAITNDEPGLAVPSGSDDPATVFLVQDGRIQRAPSAFSRYVGTRLDVFLQELRALSHVR
jgi:hypothetical protein